MNIGGLASKGVSPFCLYMSLYDIYQKRNKKLKSLGYKDYNEYLESAEWAKIRSKLNWKCCEFCDICENLDKHHISYKDLGTQSIKNIIVVCRECHKNLHCLAACHLFKNNRNPLLSSYKAYTALFLDICRGRLGKIDFLISKHIFKFMKKAPLLRKAKHDKVKRKLKKAR
jgi:hypothetical protein